jgi:5'-3' exoribonuclease 2
MGIPKFASWLSKKYPEMVSKAPPALTHGLYIDMNGLIHPCCHSEDDPSVLLRSESEKIQQVCVAVDAMVEHIRPTTILYLAMDGVAPRAKMNQQRARRYMAAADKYGNTRFSLAPREDCFSTAEAAEAQRALESTKAALHRADSGLYAVHGATSEEVASMPLSPNSGGDFLQQMFQASEAVREPTVETRVPNKKSAGTVTSDEDGDFDSNCISPGTEFMSKVSSALHAHIRQRVVAGTAWERLTVILSDSNVPGEGEHKIVDFLRIQSSHRALSPSSSLSSAANDHCHVIVGLDADLILLCLSLHIPHVVIMRDNKRSYVPPAYAKKNVAAGLQEQQMMRGSDTKEHPDGTDDEQVGEEHDTAPDEPAKKEETLPQAKKYEFYSVDVVGNGIVSELLCISKLTGQTCDMQQWPESKRRIIASNGYAYNFPASVGSRRDHPLTSPLNFKAIDDFVAMATLLGNDFVPRLPSAFCGDSAMDNLIEVYVRNVLPWGFLTTADDFHLDQLERLLAGYAKMETVLFRQHQVRSGKMKPEEAACGANNSAHVSAVDQSWRSVYYSSSSIGDSDSNRNAACASYVEGLRFVWRYYSMTSQKCSWSWFYRYHHTPFASDIAQFLHSKASASKGIEPPLLEASPPLPYSQLLCILPPSSAKLLPTVFRPVMSSPRFLSAASSEASFGSTFPNSWTIDYAGAGGKDHLAVVELPFADFPALVTVVTQLMIEQESSISDAERERNINRGFHDVYYASSMAASVALAGLSSPKEPSLGGALTEGFSSLVYARLSDVAPVPCRLKTYSSTANVRNLTEGAGRKGRSRAAAAKNADAASGLATLTGKKISFADFILASVVAFVTLAGLSSLRLLANRTVVDGASYGIISTAVAVIFGFGAGSSSVKGQSGHQRNNIRDAHVDWVCLECHSLNFARNDKCFMCGSPFDVSRTWAIFTNKIPQMPPSMDPDHSQCRQSLNLVLPAVDPSDERADDNCDML